ncbi:unnamed protein product [Brassica oleracea]
MDATKVDLCGWWLVRFDGVEEEKMDAIKVDLCGWWVMRWLMAKLTEAVDESLEYRRRSFGAWRRRLWMQCRR